MRKPEPLLLQTPLVRLEPRSHVDTSCKLLRLTPCVPAGPATRQRKLTRERKPTSC